VVRYHDQGGHIRDSYRYVQKARCVLLHLELEMSLWDAWVSRS
jgi:hypothetical protein